MAASAGEDMDFFDVIKTRNSIRKYIDKPVEPEKLEQIMTAAQLAPSWRNGQCWKFIVVSDPAKKKELIRCTSLFNQSWLGKEYAIIVACADPSRSGFRNDQRYYLVDVAIAMEHLILAATALGLGTCWIGGFEEDKIKSVLEIPADYRVVAMTTLGFPAEREGIVGKITKSIVKSYDRKPLSEVYSMNRWE
jgi:nitroreductase